MESEEFCDELKASKKCWEMSLVTFSEYGKWAECPMSFTFGTFISSTTFSRSVFQSDEKVAHADTLVTEKLVDRIGSI